MSVGEYEEVSGSGATLKPRSMRESRGRHFWLQAG